MSDAPEEIVRLARVRELTGLGGTTIWEAVKDGKFPQPVRLFEGGRAVGWLRSELTAWMRSRPRLADAEDRAA